MYHDACNGKDFTAILCWNQNRFGRFNSMEAGYWIHPLMQAGVTLVTVTEGAVDWNNFDGRIMSMLKSETNHQFLRTLSADVTRGLLAKAKRGEWVQGNPPFGFTVDANDRLILGHPDEIKIIWRIFREYLKGGSLRSITAGLNADGILSPGGSSWCRSTVRDILTRRLYTGDFVWNADPHGKYSQVRGGQVQRVNGDIGIPTSDGDEIFIPDNHPAISLSMMTSCRRHRRPSLNCVTSVTRRPHNCRTPDSPSAARYPTWTLTLQSC